MLVRFSLNMLMLQLLPHLRQRCHLLTHRFESVLEGLSEMADVRVDRFRVVSARPVVRDEFRDWPLESAAVDRRLALLRRRRRRRQLKPPHLHEHRNRLFDVGLRVLKEPAAMLDGLELFGMGFSWGGFESLVIPFDCATYRSATTWKPGGPALRFHIGFEDVDDLKADLDAGFARLREKAGA